MARRILGAILAATITALLGIAVLAASAWAAQPTHITTYDSASSVYDVVQPIARVHNASDPRLGHSYDAAAGPMDDSVSARRLGLAAKSGDALLNTGASGAGRRLPMNMQTVCATACKYDIDISDVTIKINKGRAGYAGSTAPDGTVTLTRSAFTNEEQLARTLFHERYHVDQIRSGMGYPSSPAAAGPWESAAYAAEDAWWSSR